MRTGFQLRPFLFALFFSASFYASAAEVMPSKPTRYFNDYANVVSANTSSELNRRLENFERESSSQIVVAVFPKMQTESSIEDYTQRVAQNWGVGRKEQNNGAVLFVFIADRKMFLQVGYGLEGALPDALAKRIIEDEIKPFFRNGDYASGLVAGVNAILQAAKGEYKGTGRTIADRTSQTGRWILPLLFFALFMIMILSNIFRQRGTIYSRRGRGIYPILWGGGGWGGSSRGGGGGFSGGGFSGGGGSFGGGGAGGSW